MIVFIIWYIVPFTGWVDQTHLITFLCMLTQGMKTGAFLLTGITLATASLISMVMGESMSKFTAWYLTIHWKANIHSLSVIKSDTIFRWPVGFSLYLPHIFQNLVHYMYLECQLLLYKFAFSAITLGAILTKVQVDLDLNWHFDWSGKVGRQILPPGRPP